MQIYRELAEALSQRKKFDMTITFSAKGRKGVIHAKYDALFKTVELGNATVPARELRQWLMLLYGADGKTICITC